MEYGIVVQSEYGMECSVCVKLLKLTTGVVVITMEMWLGIVVGMKRASLKVEVGRHAL